MLTEILIWFAEEQICMKVICCKYHGNIKIFVSVSLFSTQFLHWHALAGDTWIPWNTLGKLEQG